MSRCNLRSSQRWNLSLSWQKNVFEFQVVFLQVQMKLSEKWKKFNPSSFWSFKIDSRWTFPWENGFHSNWDIKIYLVLNCGGLLKNLAQRFAFAVLNLIRMQYILLRHKTANETFYMWLFYGLLRKSILALEERISFSRRNMKKKLFRGPRQNFQIRLWIVLKGI